jgi:hypothetical protein
VANAWMRRSSPTTVSEHREHWNSMSVCGGGCVERPGMYFFAGFSLYLNFAGFRRGISSSLACPSHLAGEGSKDVEDGSGA